MKTEFRWILDSHINKYDQKKETPHLSFSEGVSIENLHLIGLKTKWFHSKQYSQEPSLIYEEKKERWIQETQDSELRCAIEVFYSLGARRFLSRKKQDIKRDFKKLVFDWHPDRHKMHASLSENQSTKRVSQIIESYRKLLSKSENA